MSKRLAIPWLSVALCMMASLTFMRIAQAARTDYQRRQRAPSFQRKVLEG
jgi:hypothetical protein